MTSAFDPNQFLNATVDTPNEKRPPLPVENPAATDGLYTAVIGEVKMAGGVSDKDPMKPRTWLQALVPLQIDVPQVLQESLKLRPQLTLTDRVFIDLTDSGTIDNAPGANRRQRAYREATNLNNTGDKFSWAMMQGRVVKVKVSHESFDEGIVERINGVLRA